MIGDSDVLISKRMVLDAMCDNCDTVESSCPHYPCGRYWAVEKLPVVNQTLYGYRIAQLAIIATILNKEGLPPERVSEALTDVERIIAMVRDEFEEALTKIVQNYNR